MKDMEKEEKKYEEVFAELEKLAAQIEKPGADPTSLENDVKKAVEMIAWCRNRLHEDREKVEKLMGCQ